MAQSMEVCATVGNLERNSYVKGRITGALLELLDQKSLRDISVTGLIGSAQVSRNSFYRNYADKEDVLRQHVRAVTDDWLSSTEVSFRDEQLGTYLAKLLSHMLEHRALCELLHREDLMHLVKDEFDRVFDERYEGIYDVFRARFYAGGIYGVFLLWLERGFREAPEELATRLAGMLDKGL